MCKIYNFYDETSIHNVDTDNSWKKKKIQKVQSVTILKNP